MKNLENTPSNKLSVVILDFCSTLMREKTNTVWNSSLQVCWLCFEWTLLALSAKTGAPRQISVKCSVERISKHREKCQFCVFWYVYTQIDKFKQFIVFKVSLLSVKAHLATPVVTVVTANVVKFYSYFVRSTTVGQPSQTNSCCFNKEVSQ